MHNLRLWITPRQEIFAKAYRNPIWGSIESASGTGSTMEATKDIRRELPKLIRSYNIKTMLDAPCGDWNWMSQTERPLERYIGVDIVPDVIAENTIRFGDGKTEFMARNLVADRLPATDLILCRDCLVHLSFQDIVAVIGNFKSSKSTYLLANTYPHIEKNENLFSGLGWRRLNLQQAPFDFPEPMLMFPDCVSADEGNFMAMWRLSNLPLIKLD